MEPYALVPTEAKGPLNPEDIFDSVLSKYGNENEKTASALNDLKPTASPTPENCGPLKPSLSDVDLKILEEAQSASPICKEGKSQQQRLNMVKKSINPTGKKQGQLERSGFSSTVGESPHPGRCRLQVQGCAARRPWRRAGGRSWQRVVKVMTMFSWYSLIGQGQTKEILFWVWSMYDRMSKGSVSEGTRGVFLAVLRWSFLCLMEGKWFCFLFLFGAFLSHAWHPHQNRNKSVHIQQAAPPATTLTAAAGMLLEVKGTGWRESG